MNAGGNIFGIRVNILELISIDESLIVLKGGEIDLESLEIFIHM